MASAWGNAWGNAWGSAWGSTGGAVAIVQPILPIHPPSFRTIDAKSMADVYNRNLPEMASYTWPNRRRFYQNDNN